MMRRDLNSTLVNRAHNFIIFYISIFLKRNIKISQNIHLLQLYFPEEIWL